jgi:hypothetical protein
MSEATLDLDWTALDARKAAQIDLYGVIDDLIRDFDGLIPAGAVIAQVTLCREHLLRAGIRAGLAAATEAMARSRLQGEVGNRRPPR